MIAVIVLAITGCVRKYDLHISQSNYRNPSTQCFEKSETAGQWKPIPCSNVANLLGFDEKEITTQSTGSGNVVILNLKASVPKKITTEADGTLDITP